MAQKQQKRLPTNGWWRDQLTVAGFLAQLKEFQVSTYDEKSISFTHWLIVRDVPIGEAGMVEEIGRGQTLGFFRIAQLPVVYGQIDGRFALCRKDAQTRTF